MRDLLGPWLIIAALWVAVAARHGEDPGPEPPRTDCAWRRDPAVPGGVLCAAGVLARLLPPPSEGQRLALGRGLDLNRATSAELAAIPGIGPRGARAIAQDRRERGPFETLEELLRVRGFGPGRLEELRPFLRAGPREVKR